MGFLCKVIFLRNAEYETFLLNYFLVKERNLCNTLEINIVSLNFKNVKFGIKLIQGNFLGVLTLS